MTSLFGAKGSSLTMASSRSGMLCPSARTRRGRPGPRQVEAAGKLRLASTILSPWPRLASASSRSGDTMEGTPCNSAALKCTSEWKAGRGYSWNQIPSGHCRLWWNIYSPIQPLQPKLFSPATPAAHVTFNLHISWRKSLLAIFSCWNLIPRKIAAFRSEVNVSSCDCANNHIIPTLDPENNTLLSAI